MIPFFDFFGCGNTGCPAARCSVPIGAVELTLTRCTGGIGIPAWRCLCHGFSSSASASVMTTEDRTTEAVAKKATTNDPAKCQLFLHVIYRGSFSQAIPSLSRSRRGAS